MDEDATQLEDVPNPGFDDGNGRVRIADHALRLRPSKAQALAATTCADVGNGLLRATGLFCQAKQAFFGFVPDKVRALICIVALNSVTLARDQTTPGSPAFRAFSGLRVGVGVACEGLKTVIEVGTSKACPLGFACTVIRLTNDGVSTLFGQSAATLLCNFFTGDQDLGGLLVDVSSVQMELLDTGVDDGDEISITRNGLEIFNGIVTTGGDTISVNLDRGLNHFEFIALNEGRLPPNTAQVTVLGLGANNNLGNAVFSLSTGQVATLDIVRK